jgi:hypothetical protein
MNSLVLTGACMGRTRIEGFMKSRNSDLVSHAGTEPLAAAAVHAKCGYQEPVAIVRLDEQLTPSPLRD